MRIVNINLSNAGSTGNIMKNIAREAEAQGHTVLNLFPRQDNLKPLDDTDYVVKGRIALKLTSFAERLFGLNDCLSVFSTIRMVRKMKAFSPDIVHLHNIHGSYLNLIILFTYLAYSDVQVIWTLHDCWAFTGRCPHFEIVQCEKWRDGCHSCPYPASDYPRSRIDTTKMMHRLKKKLILGLDKLTIATPSQWLADLARQSFLQRFPIHVINNGIDLGTFSPTQSDFRKNHQIKDDDFLILGVAFSWGFRKGLDVFQHLAEDLPDYCRIVLVGTNPEIEKELPASIVTIRSTNNQKELAEIYTAADLFVNPTREENYPTVNMEAIACGTPVLTFRTGGSPEIPDETCGYVVDRDDLEALEREIRRICAKRPYSQAACLKRAAYFNKNEKFKEYVNLYEGLVK